MEFEFDKEMDSLLRRAAQGGEAVINGNPARPLHVDADEISLFAENALPVKARTRVVEHLADCERCRRILSNIISFNAETKSENVHTKEIVAGGVSIPWYKKLFAFPQIAYTMGALALVFSGVIALLVLQNARDSQNTSIARDYTVQEKPLGAKGMDSDEDTTSTETSSMSNSTATNTTTTTSGSTMTNTNAAPTISADKLSPAPMAQNNPNAPIGMLDEAKPSVEREAKTEMLAAAAPKDKSSEPAKKEDFVADGPVPRRERDNDRADNESQKLSKQQAETQSTIVQNQVTITPGERNVQRSLPMNSRNVAGKDNVTTSSEAPAGTDSKNKTTAARKAPSTRSAGGKTFNFRDGAWYDSAYSSGGTINVRRSTNEYKRLDAGLKSIAESIGGVVVVVWKGKAYRIQ
jgi:hypothetical protein